MKNRTLLSLFIVMSFLCSACQSKGEPIASSNTESNHVDYNETHSENNPGLNSNEPNEDEENTQIKNAEGLILQDREKASCMDISGPGINGQTISSAIYEKGSAEHLEQPIQSGGYELMIPSGWEVLRQQSDTPFIKFITKERAAKDEQSEKLRSTHPGMIGEIQAMDYDPDAEVYPHYNLDVSAVEAYCEVVDESPLPGSVMRYSLLEVLDRDTGEAASQYAQIEFFVREKKLIYKLSFYTDDVSKATVFSIANNFKVIK